VRTDITSTEELRDSRIYDYDEFADKSTKDEAGWVRLDILGKDPKVKFYGGLADDEEEVTSDQNRASSVHTSMMKRRAEEVHYLGLL